MANRFEYEVVSLDQVPVDDATTSAESRGDVVLVVDDERVIADTLSMILSQNGYKVLTAYDGKTALEMAQAVRPALVITDVVMPGITGVELAILVVDMFTDCKVLLFSGQAETADLLEKARDTGHEFTILSKPVHPTDMLKRVSNCLEMVAN